MPSPTDVITGLNNCWGVSDCGQLMGTAAEAGIASIEPDGVYEHLAVGVLEEGFTICYKNGVTDNVKYDVYQSSNGINCLSNHICRNDKNEFVKMTESMTDDGLIKIRQTFTISKNNSKVLITMEFTNCSKVVGKSIDLNDILIKRYADLDVDTGGSRGWAAFQARWDVTRYSVFSYNLDSDAPKGSSAHIVNMVALPSDIPLEGTYVGQLGAQQYASRNNPALLGPFPTGRTDGDGILQWSTPRFLAGETIRINMYYDAWRSFAFNVRNPNPNPPHK